jgi:hypothetical protein
MQVTKSIQVASRHTQSSISFEHESTQTRVQLRLYLRNYCVRYVDTDAVCTRQKNGLPLCKKLKLVSVFFCRRIDFSHRRGVFRHVRERGASSSSGSMERRRRQGARSVIVVRERGASLSSAQSIVVVRERGALSSSGSAKHSCCQGA